MTDLRLADPPRPSRIASNAVFGTALLIFTEIMLFTGFISAYVIAKASTLPGFWPPPGQPRLPVEATAFNTAVLLLSGGVLFVAYRKLKTKGPDAAVGPMALAILLGTFFVLLQGYEWLGLIREGLTITSSKLGSYFYMIVGAHALHAVAALIALIYYWFALRRHELKSSTLAAIQLFWFFVVLMWPLIYWQVYL